MSRVLWLPDVLRAAGLTVHEEPGWRTRGSSSFAPVAVVAHATGGSRNSTDRGEINVIAYNGSSTAPAPIAQLYLSRSGEWWVIASGRCNHIGDANLPGTGESGNDNAIGIEAQHGRGEAWTTRQYDSYVRGVAAIIRHQGWSTKRVFGHSEISYTGKTDPYFNMADFRARVAEVHSGKDDADMPIRTSLNKRADQPLRWSEWTEILWDLESPDPEDAHVDPGAYPGYNSPTDSWLDAQAVVTIDGLQPGDWYQVAFDIHTWRDGRSVDVTRHLMRDAVATAGKQFAEASVSKYLRDDQVLRVSVAVYQADENDPARPAPIATGGRWTIRQDR